MSGLHGLLGIWWWWGRGCPLRAVRVLEGMGLDYLLDSDWVRLLVMSAPVLRASQFSFGCLGFSRVPSELVAPNAGGAIPRGRCSPGPGRCRTKDRDSYIVGQNRDESCAHSTKPPTARAIDSFRIARGGESEDLGRGGFKLWTFGEVPTLVWRLSFVSAGIQDPTRRVPDARESQCSRTLGSAVMLCRLG